MRDAELVSGFGKEHVPYATQRWKPADTAPKDGSHILVAFGPYSKHWTFDQRPPCVVHYWRDADGEGFYLSCGIVEGSYNDKPIQFTEWCDLGAPPGMETPVDRTERILREAEG